MPTSPYLVLVSTQLRRPFILVSALVLWATLSGYLAQAQTTRFVSATGTGAGTTWADASNDLQAMITASASGEQVWVAGGVYKPGGNANTDRSISFTMKDGVAIYGGFDGTEGMLGARVLTNPSSTTLSGDIGTVGTGDNSLHVIKAPAGLTATAILDGFVITAGNANAGGLPDNAGGGLYVEHSSPTLTNLLVTANNAARFGGGVYTDALNAPNVSSPALTNVRFLNNRSGESGGGMATNGAFNGMSNPTLTNVSFESNTATNNGGGLYAEAFSGTSRVTLLNASFGGNAAPSGGAFHNANGAQSTLTNSVVWGNGVAGALAGGGLTVAYSLLDSQIGAGAYTDGGNNLTTTVSPFASTNSVALNGCSPAINAGSSASYTAAGGPATDLVGMTRFFNNGVIDMGAIEFQAAPVRPIIFYVNAAATGGANTGLTWADAFTDLPSALTNTCVSSVTAIWVAGGLYKPTSGIDRTVSFVMRAGIAIYGGFAGTETSLSSRTLTYPSSSTLSGDIGTAGDATDNSYHVINNNGNGLTGSARLDGFVITGGNADGTGNEAKGAGLFLNNSNPTFANCLFIKNTAKENGGAIFATTTTATLMSCSVVENRAVGGGGGFYCEGFGDLQLTNCVIQSNTASFGGGMDNLYTSLPRLVNCLIEGNVAINDGGGLLNIYNCSPVLVNVTIRNNVAPNGSGMLTAENSFPALTNCVIYGNNLTGNTLPVIRYSLLENTINVGSYNNAGNNLTTGISPFANATGGALFACSPAINAGNDAAFTGVTSLTIDLVGMPRIYPPSSGTIDMGAVEYQSLPLDPVVFTAQPAASSVVCTGAAVSAMVSVSGSGPFTYQWYNGATPVASQTTATLSVPSAQPADAGSYVAVVTNGCGPVSSFAFVLVVNAFPVVSLSNVGTGACTDVASLSVSSDQPIGLLEWFNGSSLVYTSLPQTATIGSTVAGGNGPNNGPTQLNAPLSVYVDAVGTVYVADHYNHRIQKFPPNSTSTTVGITVAGGNGFGNMATQLNSPIGVYVDGNGAIYVADQHNHRIQKFPPNSTSTTAGITVAGGNGTGPGSTQLIFPRGVYVDASGVLYVSDRDNHRIQRFPANSTSTTPGITVAGGNGTGNGPTQLSFPSGLYVDGGGAVYVADQDNHRIQKFPPNSTSTTPGITLAGGNNLGLGVTQLSSPAGVYVDASGMVYVTDQNNHRIQKFPPNSTSTTAGTTVAGGNGFGSMATQLNTPTGAYLDGSGAVYVADWENHRIQKWAGVANPVNQTLTAASYTVRVTSLGGCVATTNALTVGVPSSITAQPTASSVVCAGAVVTATVSATGSALSYQWYNGTTPIASQTTATLSIPSARANDAGSYSVVVTGNCNSVTSTGFSLTVNPATDITAQPVASSVVCAGATVSAMVSVSGTEPFSYQWYKNDLNTPVAGQTTTMLSLSNVQTADTGSYSAVVTGACGSVTSTGFSLTVNDIPTLTIDYGSSSGRFIIACTGTNGLIPFTTTGLPTGTYSLSYTRNGIPQTANVAGGNFNLASLIVGNYENFSIANGGCIGSTTEAGTIEPSPPVYVQVVGTLSNNNTLTICTGIPRTIDAGAVNGSASWTVLSGPSTANSQFSNPAVNSPTFTPAGGAGDYVLQVTASSGNCTPEVASFTITAVNSAGITSQPPAGSAVCAGGSITASVSVSGGVSSYQWFRNGSMVSGQTSATLTLSNLTSASAGSYSVVVAGNCGNSVTSSVFNLTVNQSVGITGQPAATSVVCTSATVTVFVSATGDISGYQWFKGTTALSGQNSATLTLTNLQPIDTDGYTAMVLSTSCGFVLSSVFNLTVTQNVGIVVQPAAGTLVCSGANVTQTVSVSGSGPIGFQWIKGTTNIASQTTATLSLSNVQQSPDADGYTLRVFSACNNVLSNTFNLSINQAVAITVQPVASSVVCVGSTVTAMVSISGSGPYTYEWIKGITPIASQTTATLSLTNVQVGDTDSYFVRVITPCNNVLSDPFSVTVQPPVGAVSVVSNGTLTCGNPSVTLTTTAANATTFTLVNTGASNATGQFVVNAPGSYTVRAGSMNSCTNTAVSSVSVSQNTAVSAATLAASNNSTLCLGNSITLTAGTGTNYAFSGPGLSQNSASPTAVVNQGGTFSVIVTGVNGCTASAGVTLTVTPGGVALGPLATGGGFCEGTLAQVPVSVSGSAGLQWYRNGGLVSGQTSATLTLFPVLASQAGSYVLVATGACSSATTTTAYNLAVGTVTPNIVITLPNGSSVTVAGQFPTITLPRGGSANVLITGGSFYDWTLVLDRINGYEIRQHEQNTTGFVVINRAGPYRLKVNKDGCEKTVEGQVVFAP